MTTCVLPSKSCCHVYMLSSILHHFFTAVHAEMIMMDDTSMLDIESMKRIFAGSKKASKSNAIIIPYLYQIQRSLL